MKSIPPSPAMGPGVCILEGHTVISMPIKVWETPGTPRVTVYNVHTKKKKKQEKRSHPHISKQTLSPGGGVETADDSAVTPVIHWAHNESFHLWCRHLPFGSCLEWCTWKDHDEAEWMSRFTAHSGSKWQHRYSSSICQAPGTARGSRDPTEMEVGVTVCEAQAEKRKYNNYKE